MVTGKNPCHQAIMEGLVAVVGEEVMENVTINVSTVDLWAPECTFKGTYRDFMTAANAKPHNVARVIFSHDGILTEEVSVHYSPCYQSLIPCYQSLIFMALHCFLCRMPPC